MFIRTVNNKKEIEQTEQKKPIPKEKTGKGKLSSFFSKTSSDLSNNGISKEEIRNDDNLKNTDTKNSENKEIGNSKNKTHPKDPIEDIDFGSDIEIKEEIVNPTVQENTRKSENCRKIGADPNKTNKRAREKSNDKSNKRRKRIIQNNESDSDGGYLYFNFIYLKLPIALVLL